MRDACDDARLSALLDDELDDDDALVVTRHATSCARCTRELEDLRRLRQALRSLPPVEAPPATMFQQAVLAAEHHDGRRRRTARAVAGAGALTAMTATAVWMAGGSGDGTVMPPIERYVADHVGRVDHGPLVTPVDFGR